MHAQASHLPTHQLAQRAPKAPPQTIKIPSVHGWMSDSPPPFRELHTATHCPGAALKRACMVRVVPHITLGMVSSLLHDATGRSPSRAR